MIIKVGDKMGRYRRVSSFKIMKDYEMTAKHLKMFSAMASAKNKRFFRINQHKIERNILYSKMTNSEKALLLKFINNNDFHQIHCYASMLQKQYQIVANNYKNRMDKLFMTIEDKTVFYA